MWSRSSSMMLRIVPSSKVKSMTGACWMRRVFSTMPSVSAATWVRKNRPQSGSVKVKPFSRSMRLRRFSMSAASSVMSAYS